MPSRAPRRARLRLTRIDPWSVMKTAFLLSIAFGVVTVVSVIMVWSVLVPPACGTRSTDRPERRRRRGRRDFDIQDYVGMSRVLGFTMLVAVVDVILLTAVATLVGVPLQHGRRPARWHRGHPRRGQRLTPTLVWEPFPASR